MSKLLGKLPAGRGYLIANIVLRENLSVDIATRIVDGIFDDIVLAIKVRDRGLSIHGFGRFYLHKTKRRVGRNPKTGEPAEIPVKEIIKFKCSKIYERVMLGGENDN